MEGDQMVAELEFCRAIFLKKTETKKPAGLAPCGLSGLHRMTLVITDGEFWWAGGV